MTATPNIIPIVGNLTADPDLRHTNDGTAVVNFSVASTPRVSDGNGGFKDGETVFWRVSAWRKVAEHVKASLGKGDRVVIIGEVKPNNYEKDGVQVSTVQIEAKEVAASLEWATVAITRAPKGTNQTPPAQYQQPQAPQAQYQQAPAQQAQPQYAQQGAPAQGQPQYAPQQGAPQQGAPAQQPQPQYANQGAPIGDVDFS